MKTKYLVIGVNAAGFFALEALRKHDPYGSITAVNGEEYLPYKRTKVNKHFSSGKLDIDKFKLADTLWYEENKIVLLNNTNVLSIDISNKTVSLDNGKKIEWDKLLLSTGAESYCPNSEVFKKAFSIRTYKDALEVDKRIKSSNSCLVYGLGIEGIETAAELYDSGLNVTLAGRGSGLLKRYFSSWILSDIEDKFKQNNISILYKTTLEDVLTLLSEESDTPSECTSPVSSKRESASNDFLLYSLGIEPRKVLADSCGIITDRGILVNSHMETSIPGIYAAGDCTQTEEQGTITDHWHSAQDQGRTAAANMAGLSSIWPVLKYRIKLEIFGDFYFSMRPFIEDLPDNLTSEESYLPSGAYRLFYYGNNILMGLEMAGDKPRAKLYEQAVNEGWGKPKVLELLS